MIDGILEDYRANNDAKETVDSVIDANNDSDVDRLLDDVQETLDSVIDVVSDAAQPADDDNDDPEACAPKGFLRRMYEQPTEYGGTQAVSEMLVSENGDILIPLQATFDAEPGGAFPVGAFPAEFYSQL
jgi:hypothetical protein